MKRKVDNFITNFKENESKLIKYIKENNISEFTKYMREELLTLGFYEYQFSNAYKEVVKINGGATPAKHSLI